MKVGKPSYTAEGAAAIRALETLAPARFRVFEDRYALALLSTARRIRMLPGIRQVIVRLVEKKLPGVMAFTVGRARWFDERLLAIAPGIEQIVLLGAGYDTTFARHPDLVGRLAYFEVDHPDTQVSKMERVARHRDLFGDAFDVVRTVGVDFEREDLEARLLEEGYHPDRRTCFVWSGVTMYLDRAAVEGSLRLIGRAAPGSHVLFDAVVKREFERPEYARARAIFQKWGEAIRFTIDPEDVKDLLGRFGLEVAEITEGPALREMYFAKDDPRRIQPGGILVHGRRV